MRSLHASGLPRRMASTRRASECVEVGIASAKGLRLVGAAHAVAIIASMAIMAAGTPRNNRFE
jgi:hypothetical protein